MTIKGSLLVSVPIVKRFFKFRQTGGFSKFLAVFHENRGSKRLFSKPPKGTSLRGTASFDDVLLSYIVFYD